MGPEQRDHADVDERVEGEVPEVAERRVALGQNHDVVDLAERPAHAGGRERRGVEQHDVLDDPSYEELWEGTKVLDLEMPDIPRLDLFWGDEPDDASRE